MEQGIKRSQRDYSVAFKLSVAEQVKKGEITYKEAQKRHEIQGGVCQTSCRVISSRLF